MPFPQVAVVGNARITSDNIKILSEQVGQIISELGFNLVCGGLGGVMEAACFGHQSVSSNNKCIGILPSYDERTANRYIDIVIPSGLDIGRNQLVVASGFAIVVIGGGSGTLSEVALASQIGKHILLMKGSGGWADKLTDEYLDHRQNSKLYHITDLQQLRTTLKELSQIEVTSGIIDSGHNR